MKKMILFAGAAMLAACSQSEAPEAEPEAAPVEEAAPEGPVPGKYTVTSADGTSVALEIGEGNTFTVTEADGTVVTGTYEMVDGKACFSAEGSEEPPVCNSASAPDENGVVTVTSEDGTTSTVTPIVEEAAAEEVPAE